MLDIQIKQLGTADYTPVWQAMRDFTDNRTAETPDELWVVEHPPVFTLGQNGKHEHVLHIGDIPLVQVDRGGQVTYHGPGQVVIYLLVDIARRNIAVRPFVSLIEQAIIEVLADYGLSAEARTDAPGVYVDNQKMASLGLRIRQGRSYHGLAFNVKMNLEPFTRINPCGHATLRMTQLSDWVDTAEPAHVATQLTEKLLQALSRSTL